MTAGCAVCHDHKFDPISQREFYELSAFFNNTTQPTMDGNIKDTPPTVFVPSAADQSRWQMLSAEQADGKEQARSAQTVRPCRFREMACRQAIQKHSKRSIPGAGLQLAAINPDENASSQPVRVRGGQGW